MQHVFCFKKDIFSNYPLQKQSSNFHTERLRKLLIHTLSTVNFVFIYISILSTFMKNNFYSRCFLGKYVICSERIFLMYPPVLDSVESYAVLLCLKSTKSKLETLVRYVRQCRHQNDVRLHHSSVFTVAFTLNFFQFDIIFL